MFAKKSKFKKILLIMSLASFLFLSSFKFSVINADSQFDLIKPQININGDVIYQKDLNISLMVKGAKNSKISVYMASDISNPLFSLNRQREYFELVNDESLLSKVDSSIVSDKSIESIEVSRKKLDEKYKNIKKDEISNLYYLQAFALENSHKALKNALKENKEKELGVMELFINASLKITKDKEVNEKKIDEKTKKARIEKIKDIYISYLNNSREFLYLKNMYDKTKIDFVVSERQIELKGALPYFNFSLPNAKLGQYYILISDSNNKRIWSKSFKLKEKDEISKGFIDKINKDTKNILLIDKIF